MVPVHQSSERQCWVRDKGHIAGEASLGEIWIYLLTVAFAADPPALFSAPRPFMSKWKARKKPNLCLICPPSLPQSLLPCPSCCQTLKGQLPSESRVLSHGHLQLHKQDRAHEKATIKPSGLQPLQPCQNIIFLLQRIRREGRNVQSPKLVLKSKAGRGKGFV